MKFKRYSKKSLMCAFSICLHAIKIGVIGGMGGVVYVGLVGIIYNVVFLGKLSLVFHEFIYSPQSRWGAGIILIPILGGLVVIWLIQNFGNKEHGVSEPDVLHFLHEHEGKKRYIIELTKSFASVISIGTGGSVGGEIPIVQLGATLSYLFGWIKHIPPEQRIILTAAGAAASLSAVFNAPFTGVFFAVEILLFTFNISHIILIAISSFTGYLVGYLIFGSRMFFDFKFLPTESTLILFKQSLLFIPFGILIGMAAALLISGIRWSSTFFEKRFNNPYLRHSIGLGLVGVMLYALKISYGHYYISAIGYATVQDMLNLILQNGWLILLIFFCKLIALCLTLGTGASGGIFSPSLFLGATLGGATGLLMQHLLPGLHINILYFIVAGMGGMLSSVTGALITSLVFIFEITKNYHILLPLFITVVISTTVRLILFPKGIYTFKLFQHGMMFSRKL